VLAIRLRTLRAQDLDCGLRGGANRFISATLLLE
jgi:hypothetical protein